MASVSELISLYETTESLDEAKAALDRLAAREQPVDLELGECYDEVAELAADSEDYVLAVDAQRLAIEHGCRLPDLAQEMLGWYLLKAGEAEEGEAVFAAAVQARGDDPNLHGTIGAARSDAGDHEGALRAFDRALELAERAEALGPARSAYDRSTVRRLRAEQQECRRELGLPSETAGRFAGIAGASFPEAAAYAVAWFPREEIDAALARWPSLAEDLADPDS
ncbi:MAG: hypothetical protein JSU06_19810 [Actinobacteria bacterium]|nr:hypothetical protein [Actinomycetota bacterium]